MKHPLLSLLLVVLSWNALQAQVTFPYNGVQDHREGLYAFTNATIHTRYDETLENATLVIRRGKVEAVGVGIPVPAGAVVLDCAGKSIYPSFLDPFTDYGMPEPKAEGRRPQQQPQMLSNKKGAFAWNEALKSEFRAHEHFTRDDKKAQEWLKLGFGAVLSHRPDGISRGSAALVLLGDQREHELIVEEKAAHVLSFSKGTSTQNYPSSLMGSIALLRQTYLDGAWYERHGRDEEVNLSLEAWNELQSLPQIFAVNDMLDALRAARIGEEFGVRYIIKGSGDEYQRLRELEATGSPFILPLDFPDAYDVEDPLDARLVSLQQMKHWELAPTNPARLAAEDVTFA
ncbi:MAG: amidohydrolase, partial [Bacteroidetes bacterium]